MQGIRYHLKKVFQKPWAPKKQTYIAVNLAGVLCSLSVVTYSLTPAHGNILINDSIIVDDQRGNYQRCIALANTASAQALEMARRWFDLSSLEAAKHCKAVALTNSGQHELAATELEKIAVNTKSGLQIQAGLYQNTAQAWMRAGEQNLAFSALNKAIAIDNTNIPALKDRAILNASKSDFWNAIDDLNTIIDQDPNNASVIILRASAYRHLGLNEIALEGINLALSFDKNNVDALLELALLKILEKKTQNAISIWERIIHLSPESLSGASAQLQLDNQEQISKAKSLNHYKLEQE